MRFFILALVIAVFQKDVLVSANVDKIIGVFLKVVDKIVPPDQVAAIKVRGLRFCFVCLSFESF